MSGFDRARPLWRAVVVEGLSDGRIGIVMKLHHAITDGIGGMKLQLELLDLDPDAPERPMPPPPEVHVLTQPERVVDAFHHERRRQLGMLKRTAPTALAGLVHALRRPAEVAQRLGRDGVVGRLACCEPAPHPMSPLMAGRSLSSRFDIAHHPARPARRRRRSRSVARSTTPSWAASHEACTSTTSVTASTSTSCGWACRSTCATAEAENVAGNAFVPARIQLPVDQDDPLDTMRVVHERVADARHERANELVDPLANLLNRLPTTATSASVRDDGPLARLHRLERARPAVPGLPAAARACWPSTRSVRWPAPRSTSRC